MKCEAKTELEMRNTKAASPDTVAELTEYIESLLAMNHDYGTCVYAMSLAAVAAFNLVAGKLGVTGFQAGMADLDILRRTRGMDGPFLIIKGEDMLYPQYDLHGKLAEALKEWQPWASEQAKKKLAESPNAHEAVIQRWQDLAALTK
jgi:hypothetical protein